MNSFPPPASRYAIYARYSTDHQTFKSIEDQYTLCRAYGDRQGWLEAGAYHDAARSGATVIGRAGLFEMLAAADRGEFSVILVEDLDRLSRSASGAHGLVEEMEALDITVCTVSSGPVTDMEVAFKAAHNARQLKAQAEKTRRGQEGTVKDGRISGQVSYGYRRLISLDGKNGRREIDEEKAEVVRRIYNDYLSGLTPLDIAKALNAEGIPGPRGGSWKPGAIYGNRDTGVGILRNRLYVGINEWGRTVTKHNRHKGTSTAKVTAKADRLVVEVPHLRIVSDEVFQAVEDRLESRRSGPSTFRDKRRPDYLLSGLVRCGTCGRPYAVVSDKLSCIGSAREGTCDNRRRVAREDLEAVVLAGLKDRLLRPELIGPYLEAYRAEVERLNAAQAVQNQAAQGHLKDISRQIANVMAQVRGGLGNGDDVAGRLLRGELERLEIERQGLDRQVRARPRALPLPMAADALVERLAALLDDLRLVLDGKERDAQGARDQLRALIDKVIVTPIEAARPDRRGCGPVRITVEGPLTALVELADPDRVIQHSSRPGTILDPAILTFRYYVDFIPEDNRLEPQTYADRTVFAQLLDDADVPVTRRNLIDALAEADGCAPDWQPDYAANAPLTLRAIYAIRCLKAAGDIRAIDLRPTRTGFVWNHIDRSDDDWKARALAKPTSPPRLPPRVIRLSAPEAFVVVLGPKEEVGAASLRGP